ncbi:NAD(P)-binding protein [Trichoderma citrinoviride]|uniref:NAD(P)-binding protein n=1 Tax=Trichoderma citrinoviride TaxID=58853 RepID=A0A2T4B8S7_9HYPO|nr:NAD(P)-binding protein [Trichoderma citrinoviride]PTB65733.1 NAD(P)-binding protein [Trichoderma citrinoviride]
MTYKNVVIVGASGSIGKIILEGLITAGGFDLTVVSRKDSSATFPPDVNVYKSDFTDSDLQSAFKGQDVVISAVGAAGLGEQKRLVDAAMSAGVKRFLPSEFSSSSQDAGVLQLLPLFGQKLELIEYLKTKQSATFSWTGIATSLLFDWGLRNGFLEYDLVNKTATIWDGGNKRFTLTNEKDLGKAVASVLQNAEETANKYLFVSSVETSQNEILAALEHATGAKWTVNNTTTKEQVDAAIQKLSAGDFSGAYALVRATSYSCTPGLKSNYATDEDLSNDLLGLKPTSVAETVKLVTGFGN